MDVDVHAGERRPGSKKSNDSKSKYATTRAGARCLGRGDGFAAPPMNRAGIMTVPIFFLVLFLLFNSGTSLRGPSHRLLWRASLHPKPAPTALSAAPTATAATAGAVATAAATVAPSPSLPTQSLHGAWSLDRSVLPAKSNLPRNLIIAGVLSALLASSLSETTITAVTSHLPNLSVGKAYSSVASRAGRFVQGLASRLRRPKVSDSSPWRPCQLVSKASLGGGIRRFTFFVSDRDIKLGKLDASAGRKLVLCAADRDGRLVKNSYFWRRSPADANQIEIFDTVSTGVREKSAVDFVHSADDGYRASMAAIRLGEQTLRYRGNLTIRSMQIIACGLGITAVLPILSSILSSADVDVEKYSLLWLNDRKEAFILDDEVQQLEQRYPQLEVLRVAQPDLNLQKSILHTNVRQLVGNYTTGAVAIVAGGSALAEKTIPLLGVRGYPPEQVIYIAA